MTELKNKKYLALILATYALVLIVVIIKSNTPSDANEFFELIGSGIGVALLPLLIMRLLGNTAGWITMAICALGFSIDQLHWIA